MKNKYINFTLWAIFLFTLTHFLKDITQDILRIFTPLDLLGNADEDVSKFPEKAKQVYVILGYSSLIAEIFLLISIPLILAGKGGSRLKRTVWIVIFVLLAYLISAVLLDPRFR